MHDQRRGTILCSGSGVGATDFASAETQALIATFPLELGEAVLVHQAEDLLQTGDVAVFFWSSS